ncbi:hypothetical protein AVEN_82671-1 [Araneus ventricosus]|uniref:Uncharacterized protein n=1 Tax=Araneus ventricosus TaxID=182803 RepID=A0A4Y2FVU7_ARAVE|nr:hypothetical protein AVEN_82671-1 [Araneus ventricosus]
MAASEWSIVDPKYRFAVELIHIVNDLCYAKVAQVFPRLQDDLFKEEYKQLVKFHLEEEEKHFIELIARYTNGKFDENTYQKCFKTFIDFYRPQVYSESGLVCFCAAIVYLAIFFSNAAPGVSSIDGIKDYIFSLLSDVLSRGPLEHSSW